jgi:anti-anti-sigma factor
MTQPENGQQVLTIEPSPSAVVITIRAASGRAAWGVLDQAGSQVLAEWQNQPSQACIVELTELAMMGSAQVALLVRIWKAVRERSGEFIVVCPQAAVLDVIELAGLGKLWQIVPHRSAAEHWLARRQLEQVSPVRRSRVLLPVGVCGLVMAAVGLFAPAGGFAIGRLSDEVVRQATWVAGCCVGIVAGCAIVFRNVGRGRIPGAIIALITLLLATAGILQLTRNGRIGPNSPEAARDAAAL